MSSDFTDTSTDQIPREHSLHLPHRDAASSSIAIARALEERAGRITLEMLKKFRSSIVVPDVEDRVGSLGPTLYFSRRAGI